MLVPPTPAASTSPSPAKPPVTATVAPTRSRLSGSVTASAPASVTAPPSSVKAAFGATLLKVGASLRAVMSMVVVELPVSWVEPLSSTTVHTTVRLASDP